MGVVPPARNGNCKTFVGFFDLFLPEFVSPSLYPLKRKEPAHFLKPLSQYFKVATICLGKKVKMEPLPSSKVNSYICQIIDSFLPIFSPAIAWKSQQTYTEIRKTTFQGFCWLWKGRQTPDRNKQLGENLNTSITTTSTWAPRPVLQAHC